MRDSLGRSRTRSFGFRYLSGLTKADKCPSWPRASPRNSVSRIQAVRIIDMSDTNAWCHLRDCARTRPHRGDSKRVRFRADGRTTLQSFQSPVSSKQRIWRAHQALDSLRAVLAAGNAGRHLGALGVAATRATRLLVAADAHWVRFVKQRGIQRLAVSVSRIHH